MPSLQRHHIIKLASHAARHGIDAVLPPRCLACGEQVTERTGLCAACWSRLRFIEAPLCRGCGRPLPKAAGMAEGHCGDCIRQPPPLDRMRSALVYDEASRGLILNFKHGGRIEGVRVFAGWMAEAGRDLLAEADLILPVPLHRWRLLGRGFNQSAMLARLIARRVTRPCPPNLLRRTRSTRSQQGLGGRARAANMTAAAFGVARGREAELDGARIVLVDDVLTTGSTLAACTEVLREHGAAAVSALTLARTVGDHDIV